MTRAAEIVTVLADGKQTKAWKHVHMRTSLYSVARYFGLVVTEARGNIRAAEFSTAYSFPPGTPIEISAGNDLLCKGYVNVYAPTIDPKNHDIEIEGRSRSQDWVDGAAVHDRGEWQNKTPLEIAKDLDSSYGVGIQADVELEPIEYFHIYQGETVQQALERLLRDQEATPFGQADGSVLITNASKAKRHAGGLIEGYNILKMAARLTDMSRHSEVTVKGQRRTGVDDSDLRVKQTFKDRGMRRFRPKIIVHEGNTTPNRAQRRAQYEAERALGFSVRASLIVQGWRDDKGELWQPNRLVYVESPSLKIAGDMLIQGIDMHQVSTGGSRGTQCEMSLVHPAAYKGTDGKATKTAPDWGSNLGSGGAAP